MKKSLKVPTFDELGNKLLKEFPEHYEDFLKNKKEILISLKLLKDNQSFYKYLLKTDFEDYDLPTVFFGEIVYYIKNCFKNNKIDEIRKILEYLDELSKKGDNDISDLIVVGFFELLVKFENILKKVYKMMPKNLKKLFNEYFSRISKKLEEK